jgi:hypothetical protein
MMYCGHDAVLAGYAAAHLHCCKDVVALAEVSYCYRWGVSEMHLSGSSNPEKAYKDYWPGKPGTYELVPEKETDWIEVRNQAALTAVNPKMRHGATLATTLSVLHQN